MHEAIFDPVAAYAKPSCSNILNPPPPNEHVPQSVPIAVMTGSNDDSVVGNLSFQSAFNAASYSFSSAVAFVIDWRGRCSPESPGHVHMRVSFFGLKRRPATL